MRCEGNFGDFGARELVDEELMRVGKVNIIAPNTYDMLIGSADRAQLGTYSATGSRIPKRFNGHAGRQDKAIGSVSELPNCGKEVGSVGMWV